MHSINVTRLLEDWKEGDAEALERVIQLAYPRLRVIARSILSQRRDLHTLQATELIGEIFEELLKAPVPEDSLHFLNLAAKMMRETVRDYARAKYAKKRTPEASGLQSWPTEDVNGGERIETLLALDEAFGKLRDHYPRQAKVVGLRFYLGLTVDETAQAVGVSAACVKRDWSFAKRWLNRALDNRGLGGQSNIAAAGGLGFSARRRHRGRG